MFVSFTFHSSTMTTSIRIASESGNNLNELTDEEERLFTLISFDKVHKVVSLLPQLRDLEVRNIHSHTPLLHTAVNAQAEHLTFLIKLLLQCGSEVNAKDVKGKTPLMHVIRRGGSVDAIRTLMRYKLCEPDLGDKKGNTALMHAAKAGNAEAIAILLFLPSARKHADVNARNCNGLTALDVAVKHRQAVCCRMLVEEGKADVETVKDVKSLQALIHEGSRQGR